MRIETRQTQSRARKQEYCGKVISRSDFPWSSPQIWLGTCCRTGKPHAGPMVVDAARMTLAPHWITCRLQHARTNKIRQRNHCVRCEHSHLPNTTGLVIWTLTVRPRALLRDIDADSVDTSLRCNGCPQLWSILGRFGGHREGDGQTTISSPKPRCCLRQVPHREIFFWRSEQVSTGQCHIRCECAYQKKKTTCSTPKNGNADSCAVTGRGDATLTAPRHTCYRGLGTSADRQYRRCKRSDDVERNTRKRESSWRRGNLILNGQSEHGHLGIL